MANEERLREIIANIIEAARANAEREARALEETDELICDATKTNYCHLQGVRYIPRSCAGTCELVD